MTRTVAVDPENLVIVTEDHGGYLGGRCVACGASGWLYPRYGYPHRVKDAVMSNRIIHRTDCPMNDVLTSDGSLEK